MGATFTCLEQRLDNITADRQQKVWAFAQQVRRPIAAT
jgi:hypothetical protein